MCKPVMFEDLHIEPNSGYYIVCLGLQSVSGGRKEGGSDNG